MLQFDWLKIFELDCQIKKLGLVIFFTFDKNETSFLRVTNMRIM
jgi:hypothetical protein